MLNRSNFRLYATMMLIGTGKVLAQCNSYSCPPCYNNVSPWNGNGQPAQDGSGRRVLNVFIDSSWGNPTNPTIWNATDIAIREWNSATDASCQGSAGSQTGYYLSHDQNAPANIIIQRNDYIPTCAQNEFHLDHSAPDYIKLRGKIATQDAGVAANHIKHELGHSLGLDNCTGSCSNLDSIMCSTAALDTCLASRAVVIASDVGQSNRNLSDSTRFSCPNAASGTTGEWATSCPDNNGCGNVSDGSGYPVLESDYCQYDYGCPSGYSVQTFNTASGPIQCCEFDSPIVIDTKGDGFDLTSAAEGVLFDFSGDGHKVQIAWTAPNSDDAWLVLDRNGNGKIDSAKEMFGNITDQPISAHPNGFLNRSTW